MKTPHLHVDNFLPGETAEAMRGDFETHCSDQNNHKPDVHQVWNYWHVPPIYTYLRTTPQKIIAAERARAFHDALKSWARENLGMTRVTWPYLSLYVDGCMQNLHNDSVNGRFGYVFSLTRNARRTSGGETIVLREGDLFRDNLSNAAAGINLYDLIAPNFNRLALFDDRMPHGVSRVEGSMDPLEGRLVLHGHISEGGGFADGPLDLMTAIQHLNTPLRDAVPSSDSGDRGPLVIRLFIQPDGSVREVRVLVNRIAHPDGRPSSVLVDPIIAAANGAAFPAADQETEVTIPLTFGGAIK